MNLEFRKQLVKNFFTKLGFGFGPKIIAYFDGISVIITEHLTYLEADNWSHTLQKIFSNSNLSNKNS